MPGRTQRVRRSVSVKRTTYRRQVDHVPRRKRFVPSNARQVYGYWGVESQTQPAALEFTVLSSGMNGGAIATSSDWDHDVFLGHVHTGSMLVIGYACTQGSSPSSTPLSLTVTGATTFGATTTGPGSNGANTAWAGVQRLQVRSGGEAYLRIDTNATWGLAWIALEYRGQQFSSPVVWGEASTFSAAGPYTLNVAPATADHTVQFAQFDISGGGVGKGVTAGSGFTTIKEIGNVDDRMMFSASYRTGSTSTSVNPPTHDGVPSASSFAGVAVNVKDD